MICYRDMTFCSYYLSCEEENCDIALTEEIEACAEKVGLPIAQISGKPLCFKEKKNENRILYKKRP